MNFLIPVKKKNKTKLVVDFGHISLYHSFVCVGIQLSLSHSSRIAILGLGGGSLCMFLRKCYDDVMITAVELDPAMLEVARSQFELMEDERLEVQVKDGLDFLKDEAVKGNKYSSVMFDMDSKDRTLGLSCPPKQFLDNDALGNVNAILTDDGHFILNLVCRDPSLHDSIISTLKRHFRHLVSIKLYEEVNEVVFGTNSSRPYSKNDLEIAAKGLNVTAREKKLVNIKCVDIVDFLQSATVIS